MHYDNPAARLLVVLEAGQKKAAGLSAREVWQELLDVQNDDALLMSRLGKLMELPYLTVEALKETQPELAEASSHWVSKVNGALMSQDVGGKWETFISRIDTHTISYLRMAAVVLQQRTNTSAAPTEKLLELRAELDAILVEMLVSDEAPQLKEFVARSLRKIIATIDEYKITGSATFIDSIEAAIGHAAIDPTYHSFLVDNPLGRRLSNALQLSANIVTIIQGLPELSTLGVALLTRLSQ